MLSALQLFKPSLGVSLTLSVLDVLVPSALRLEPFSEAGNPFGMIFSG